HATFISSLPLLSFISFFFFFLTIAPTDLYTLSLHDALPICWARVIVEKPFGTDLASARELNRIVRHSFSEEQTYRIDHFLGKERSEEHTSELQSRENLVCRLLLEKKKKKKKKKNKKKKKKKK